MEIILPKNENREFATGVLDNGISYINIQDKNLDRSIVTVSVNVGSLSDPRDYQGLAHFSEHMLFLGSKKYPGDESFSKFLNENGGSSNAYTADFQTVYYFSVFNKKLKEAIDRFSRFFIDPLFDKNSVDREINAIESEHMKNIQQDNWRMNYFMSISSKKDSLINRFKTGNLSSLKKDGVRDAMISFYKKHYVSSNIKIVSVSSLDNNEVNKYIQKSFSNIERKDAIELKLSKPFFEKKSQSYFLKSIAKYHSLVYYWEIPEYNPNYIYTHSPSIISHVISSVNEKSLSNFLKKKGLTKYVISYVHDEGIFIVNFQLTKFENWKEVDSYFRYYMENLKNSNWAKIGDYFKKKDKVLFNYSQKIDSEDIGSKLVESLLQYPLKKSYIGSDVIEKVDVDQINNLQDEYLNFDLVSIILSTDEYPDDKNIKFIGEKKTEQYYNLDYSKVELLLGKPKEFDYEIVKDNPFLEIKPKIIINDDHDTIPKSLNIGNTKSMFGNVFKFGESSIFCLLSFTNLEFISDIKTYVSTYLLASYINNKIVEDFNLANQIGFSTGLFLDDNSSIFKIQLVGLNDKFDEYFGMILDYIKNFKYDLEDSTMILSIIDSLKDGYMNIQKNNPWNYSSHLQFKNINKNFYSIEEMITYLNSYKVENFAYEVSATKNRILYQSKLNSFFYGNVTKEDLFGNDLKNENMNKLNMFTNIEKPRNMLKILEDIDEIHPNKEEKNNFVRYSFLIGKFNPLENLKLLVLSIAISQPFYDELRTKKQFGYLVASYSIRIQDNYYLVQKIQSVKSINEICESIDKFNINFLKNLTEEEFNKYLKAAVDMLNENENTTRELFNKFSIEVIENKFQFNREDLQLKKVKDLTFDSFKQFFKEKILDVNPVKLIIRNQSS